MTFSCIFLHKQGYNPTLSREKAPSQALTTTKHPPSLTAQGCALLVRLGDWREDGKDSPALFLSRTYNEVHRRPLGYWRFEDIEKGTCNPRLLGHRPGHLGTADK